MTLDSRDQIVTAIHKQFLKSADGGGACVVSGRPGVGKTFVVERFLRGLPAATPQLRGRGLRTGCAPLLPICEAIRTCKAGDNLDRLKAAAEEYAAAVPFVREALAPLVRARTRTQYTRADLKGVVPSETYTFVVLTKLVEAFGNTELPVLFLDDVQWIDASSIGFLGYVISQIRSKKIFLLLVRRQNGAESERIAALLEMIRREAPERSVELSLGGLNREEQRAALSEILGRSEFENAELDWLDRATQGIPYYLREFVDLLRTRGDLAEVGGVWRMLARPPAELVAPSLRAHVHERLHGLLDSERTVAEAIQFAACLGTTFDARVVAEAMKVPSTTVARVLGSIESKTGLVRRVGTTTSFCFDHDISRDAVLGELGDFAAEMHARVADVLAVRREVDPAVVAYQFAAANVHEPAARWFLKAADNAIKNSLFEAALQYGRSAEASGLKLESGADDELRVHAVSAIGHALVGSERYSEAVAALTPHAIGLRPREASPLNRLLGRAGARLPDDASHHAAVASLRKALEGLVEGKDDAELAAVWSDLVYAYDAIGDHAASQAAFRAAARAAKNARDDATSVRLMRMTCIFWQPEKVAEILEKAIRLARRCGLKHEEALCENNLGSAFFGLGDLVRAKAHYERSYEGLVALGGFRCDTPLNNLGLVSMLERKLDEAALHFEAAESGGHDPHTALFVQSNYAVLEAVQGRLSEAIERLQAVVSKADRTGDLFYQDCLRHNLARALLLAGRPRESYETATGCELHHSSGDELLVRGKRASLLIDALVAQRLPRSEQLLKDAALLTRTTKPQAWLYQAPWYHTDIEFWED